MKPSTIHSATSLQALLARFGSRRALIEELDRRKRLALLNPPAEHFSKGDRTKIKNEPNPQWREISTPSLLIPGETIQDIKDASLEIRLSPELQAHNEQIKQEWLERFHPELAKQAETGEISTRSCKKCGISVDLRTRGCTVCQNRHYMRRRADRVARSKQHRDVQADSQAA